MKNWDDAGASSVEYGLLVVSIAAVIVVVIAILGTYTQGEFDDTCDNLASQVDGANCSTS
jgi:Flp pilus assembly pilin Flp